MYARKLYGQILQIVWTNLTACLSKLDIWTQIGPIAKIVFVIENSYFRNNYSRNYYSSLVILNGLFAVFLSSNSISI